MDVFLHDLIMGIQYLVLHFHLLWEGDVYSMIAGEVDKIRKCMVKFFKADGNPLSWGSGVMHTHLVFVFNLVGCTTSPSKESLLPSVRSEQQRSSDDRLQLTHTDFTPRAKSMLILVPKSFLILWDSMSLLVFRGAATPVLVPWLCKRIRKGGG